MYLAAISHHCRKRQRLAATARAKIDHLLARRHARKQARKLRAFVLDFDSAVAKDFQARQIGARGEAKAPGGPRRGLGIHTFLTERGQCLVA